MTVSIATVHARAALAGNPSDMYYGAVLAIPVRSFAARVEVSARDEIAIEPESHLIHAALMRMRATGHVRWSTDIPRSVGLAGSSALIIGTLKAIGATGDPLELAQLALSIERDDLDIPAGLQDRAVQAFDGAVLVDTAGATPFVTRRRPRARLRFVVAWMPSAAADSGGYHLVVRAGIAAPAMTELGDIAREAADAFEAADSSRLAQLMGASASVRTRLAPLSAKHEILADAMRGLGLSPNSAGSGGAAVAVITDDDVVDRLRAALAPIGGDYVIETVG